MQPVQQLTQQPATQPAAQHPAQYHTGSPVVLSGAVSVQPVGGRVQIPSGTLAFVRYTRPLVVRPLLRGYQHFDLCPLDSPVLPAWPNYLSHIAVPAMIGEARHAGSAIPASTAGPSPAHNRPDPATATHRAVVYMRLKRALALMCKREQFVARIALPASSGHSILNRALDRLDRARAAYCMALNMQEFKAAGSTVYPAPLHLYVEYRPRIEPRTHSHESQVLGEQEAYLAAFTILLLCGVPFSWSAEPGAPITVGTPAMLQLVNFPI